MKSRFKIKKGLLITITSVLGLLLLWSVYDGIRYIQFNKVLDKKYGTHSIIKDCRPTIDKGVRLCLVKQEQSIGEKFYAVKLTTKKVIDEMEIAEYQYDKGIFKTKNSEGK